MKNRLLAVILTLVCTSSFAQFTLEKLQTNYQTTPLGTDIAIPQFSWQMHSIKKGIEQTAYQIVVSDENGHKIWDSNKVLSGLSHGIQYAGPGLAATTRYSWQLHVWGNKGKKSTTKSWFETGFLNPKITAWSGADWIGGGAADIPFYSHYQSVYKLQFNIEIKANSQKAAFVFGANDSRLKNKYLNYMAVEKAHNESFVALEIDLTNIQKDTAAHALFNIYRVGYTAKDSVERPIKSLKVPKSIIHQQNMHQKHMVLAECNFGVFEFYIDGATAKHKIEDAGMIPASPYGKRGFNINPVGVGNDYISFPMLADIGFWTKENQEAEFSGIKVLNFRSPGNALFLENLHGKLFTDIPQVKDAYVLKGNTLRTANPSRNATPMLRNTFKTANKAIKKARLYATARGIYEMYINGQPISDDRFNPGLTQYNKHHMYQTYDVTKMLKPNQANAVGAWLSEGWWSGNITYSGENWNWFGDRQSLLAKLVVTYADGTEQVMVTDKNWKLYTDGPIRVGSFFQGEVYDASKEAAIENWKLASFNDESWKAAAVVPLEGTAIVGDAKYGRYTASLPYDDFNLVGQMGTNAKVVKTLSAIDVQQVRPKVFVYDMGQNMVGVPQINIKNGIKGQVINLRYAEVKYPDLPDYKGNEGMVMMENIRAALTQDQYILKGGDETIQPRFTFHGYRFLEITGVEAPIPLADVKGLVISSIVELSSSYHTNNDLVNKLWENITWSLRSNFLSIPTDTPARNERMGWSGDISVFSKSATYLTDANLFLRRHLMGMRDIQPANGRFTDVAPVGGGFGGTLWGSAGIVVAWETYRQYGDIQLLAEHFDAMTKYVDFLETKIDKSTGILNEGPLGDWLSPEGNKNDNTLFWMSYYAYDLDILSQMATALGKTEAATTLKVRSEAIKKTFNEVYVDKNTHKTIRSGEQTAYMGPPNERPGTEQTAKNYPIDTQASYAIPLALGTFNAENKPHAVHHLGLAVSRKNKDNGGIERPENALMTGFIGTASISEALSENGSNALAYKLLTNQQYPSWLYSVVNGATSIWERLNSYTKEDGFGGNNSMNSFNHYSFGAVAAWMYNYSLGIQRHATEPAFKQFVLKPMPDPNGNITAAKGHYDSIYGRIESAWTATKGGFSYSCTVPANTTAVLYLPAKSKVSENGVLIKGSKIEGNFLMKTLKSGKYNFEVVYK